MHEAFHKGGGGNGGLKELSAVQCHSLLLGSKVQLVASCGPGLPWTSHISSMKIDEARFAECRQVVVSAGDSGRLPECRQVVVSAGDSGRLLGSVDQSDQ